MEQNQPESEDRVVVDFQRRETEAGWQRILDQFGLRATPLWFDWIQWVLALSAVMFFFARSKSITLGIVIAISVATLWLHFQAVFYRIEFRGLPFVKSEKAARVMSISISGALAFLAYRVAVEVAGAVAQMME